MSRVRGREPWPPVYRTGVHWGWWAEIDVYSHWDVKDIRISMWRPTQKGIKRAAERKFRRLESRFHKLNNWVEL